MKTQLINNITSNSVYLPASGLVQNLRKALTKLSESDLANLDLLISLKVEDSVAQRLLLVSRWECSNTLFGERVNSSGMNYPPTQE